MSVITIDHVTKAFGTSVVLHDFTETFQEGEFITLLGPSGCGKTTMLRIIAGFEKPTKGRVLIDEQVVSGDNVFVPPERRNIGMVFQSYAVWPHMTVRENVAYPLDIQKKERKEIKKKVDQVLATVHLSQYADRIPSQLSGGQQQRVALARALVAEPKLLLLDEPLSNLDAKLRESMRFEIKEIQNQLAINVVYVTHDQTEAMAMSDRIVVINNGTVQQVGAPSEIYNAPTNPFVADFVGKIDFLPGVAEEGCITLEGTSQAIPYEGDLRCPVIVGIRPEWVTYTDHGDLSGTVKTHYFLGDVNDCRIDIGGGKELRVITNPFVSRSVSKGDAVSLHILKSLVYRKDMFGSDYLAIKT
ncbi:MAG: ABC transporter ATP-binding protein [Sphaerochaeta sp.]|jgi:iron(III) transport system ATP-binding protein|nr:ABC transporter ATP-binding protein [Sphaerochaeta sp.]